MMLVNLSEVIRGHNHFLAENERLVAEESEHAAKHAVDHVAKYPEFKPRTGKLQKATKARAIRTRGGRLIRLTNNLAYAQSIDTGARPHVIRPRNAKLLRFKSRNGKWIFARKVNHPGNRPYKFGWFAIDSAYRLLGQGLKHRMTSAAAKF